MKRLFVAINLQENIKDNIEKMVNSLKIGINQRENLRKSAAEIRFLRRENWHLTISFLGYQPDSAMDLILKSMRETIEYVNSLILENVRINVEFEKIILAPPNNPPRMIWLTITKETSQILAQIKNNLENNLIKNGVKFKRENRGYNGHITLARFANQSQISSREFFANIQKELAKFNAGKIKEISVVPQSLDLMESHLKRTGAEYKILLSVKI